MTTVDFYEIDCDDLDFPNLIKVHPTSTMIKNIDMKKEFERAMGLTIKLNKRHGKWSPETEMYYTYKNLFGTTKNIDDCLIFRKMLVLNAIPMCDKSLRRTQNPFNFRLHGIEIMGLKPSSDKYDNKIKYDTIKLQDLKQLCKKNGLKKYSTKGKVELVKMLLSI